METAWLVRAAAEDDQAAWDALVARYNGLLWSIARGYRLSPSDAADVVQTAWFRLVERLDTIRDPEHVGAWLATTARRECLRVLRGSGRVTLADEDDAVQPTESAPGPDAQVLASERDGLLWQAVTRLPGRCHALVRMLMADPPPSYEDVSAALDMPVGSIGPTRARCLAHLRELLEDIGVTADAVDEGREGS